MDCLKTYDQVNSIDPFALTTPGQGNQLHNSNASREDDLIEEKMKNHKIGFAVKREEIENRDEEYYKNGPPSKHIKVQDNSAKITPTPSNNRGNFPNGPGLNSLKPQPRRPDQPSTTQPVLSAKTPQTHAPTHPSPTAKLSLERSLSKLSEGRQLDWMDSFVFHTLIPLIHNQTEQRSRADSIGHSHFVLAMNEIFKVVDEGMMNVNKPVGEGAASGVRV